MNATTLAGPSAIGDIITAWIARVSSPEATDWFRSTVRAISNGEKMALMKATGLAPRKLSKLDLPADAPERIALENVRPGFDATGISIDQLGRIGFVLAAWHNSDEEFAQLFDDICRTAEINELVAYYRGLPLYPGPERLLTRAREGLRSGMKPVFEAVAHRSPYPREMLDEHAWNQMVLKALFVDSTLAPIQGIDERGNRDLAETLIDYAHERWAARRPISVELWRCVVPFTTGPECEALYAQAVLLGDISSSQTLRTALDRNDSGHAGLV